MIQTTGDLLHHKNQEIEKLKKRVQDLNEKVQKRTKGMVDLSEALKDIALKSDSLELKTIAANALGAALDKV